MKKLVYIKPAPPGDGHVVKDAKTKMMNGSTRKLLFRRALSGRPISGHVVDREKGIDDFKDYEDFDYKDYFNNDRRIEIGTEGLILDLNPNLHENPNYELYLFQYRLLTVHPEVAPSKEAIRSHHYFYIENVEKEAKDEVFNFNITIRAGTLLAELMGHQLRYVASLFMIPTKDRIEEVVKRDLIKYIDASKAQAKAFVEAVDDPQLPFNAQVRLGIEYGVIQKASLGYMMGNKLLGNTLEDATRNLGSKPFEDFYLKLVTSLNSKAPDLRIEEYNHSYSKSTDISTAEKSKRKGEAGKINELSA